MHGVEQRNAQVVGEVHAVERPRQLEAARQSAMRALMGGQTIDHTAVEIDGAGFVLHRAADAIDQRALAGAVRPDQPEPLARLHLEIDAIERDEAAETFADVVDVQQRAHGPLRRKRSCTSPTRPLGAMMTKATSSRPTISRFTAEEMVTVAICCSEPSRMVPTSGPIQLVVPPIIGMAIELTAYSRPNVDAGCK